MIWLHSTLQLPHICTPQGRHCCLCCTITYDQLKVPPDLRTIPAQPRTLASLNADHAKFVGAGSNLKVAKEFSNVIGLPIFDIELDHVSTHALEYCVTLRPLTNIKQLTPYMYYVLCVAKVFPPGLHISLGIFYQLFTLLEESCHELDLLVAHNANPHLRTGHTFEAYCADLRKRHHLREQSATLLERAEQLDQLANLVALTASQVNTSHLLTSTRTAAASYREKHQHRNHVHKLR